MKQHSNETFELAHILTNITEAQMRGEVLTQSPNVGKGAKYFIKTNIVSRLSAVKRDILAKLPQEDVEIMKADVLDEEVALQLHAIKNGVLTLRKENRDRVEALIEELLQHELSTENAAA